MTQGPCHVLQDEVKGLCLPHVYVHHAKQSCGRCNSTNVLALFDITALTTDQYVNVLVTNSLLTGG